MAVKRGLGTGLDTLIPDLVSESREKVAKQETLISINDIDPNKGQPRSAFDEEALKELAESIKQYGIIEPLVVQKKGKRYEIIAGERRFRAARIAGLKEVPVVVKEFADEDVFVIALLENIQREDLNPIEEARAYQKLIDDHDLKQEQVAEKVSKKRSTVTNSMRLLKLPKTVQDMIAIGEISEGHGRSLLGFDDPALQIRYAQKIYEENLSVRQIEKIVNEHKHAKDVADDKETSSTKKEDTAYKDVENKLKAALGTKVSIRKKTAGMGKIEIEYYSLDELERLIELFENTGKG